MNSWPQSKKATGGLHPQTYASGNVLQQNCISLGQFLQKEGQK